jgi:hypothetical protein
VCEGETAPQLFDDWFDPIENAVRGRARESIEEFVRGDLDAALARRHASRTRSLTDRSAT